MAKLRAGLLSLKDLLATAWPIVLITLIGLLVAYQFVEPAPPKKVVISTGSESGAYYSFAKRYAHILERSGIQLEVKASAGSVENLARIDRGEADIAFLQGGVATPLQEDEASPILSLGSAFYEPVWVFYRGPVELDRLHQLKGKRIAVGQEGSGVRSLAMKLLEANELDARENLIPLGGLKAAEELQQGRLDAIFIIAAPEAPVVQVLLRSPGVRLMSFAQANAYPRHFPFLSRLVLPEGAVDLVRNYPPKDTVLLAATATIVVREDMHPAINFLLLQAAAEVHGKAGFFQRVGEFPAEKDATVPIADEAKRFFKSGPPFLQRYLPFWLAVLVDRLLVMLLPIVALLLPLIKVAPAIYTWRVRSKIFRCYGELKFLEHEIKEEYEPSKADEYLRRLNELEHSAENLSIPLAFSDLLYTLREHIGLVRKILRGKSENEARLHQP